jgi:hypothetical protein
LADKAVTKIKDKTNSAFFVLLRKELKVFIAVIFEIMLQLHSPKQRVA